MNSTEEEAACSSRRVRLTKRLARTNRFGLFARASTSSRIAPRSPGSSPACAAPAIRLAAGPAGRLRAVRGMQEGRRRLHAEAGAPPGTASRRQRRVASPGPWRPAGARASTRCARRRRTCCGDPRASRQRGPATTSSRSRSRRARRECGTARRRAPREPGVRDRGVHESTSSRVERAPASRLATRAPRRSRCRAGFHHGLASRRRWSRPRRRRPRRQGIPSVRGRRAGRGPCRHAVENRAPCQAQVTIPFSHGPSEREPPECVQASSTACRLPPSLKTAMRRSRA